MKILLAEDDPALSELLTAVLSNAGFTVDATGDGEEAEFLGSTEEYDAVVLDLGLPRLDGLSVLKAWRSAGQTAPVLILTARSRWSEKLSGFNAGADDYVTKPFNME
jgi:two-component system OmpR family response regulator